MFECVTLAIFFIIYNIGLYKSQEENLQSGQKLPDGPLAFMTQYEYLYKDIYNKTAEEKYTDLYPNQSDGNEKGKISKLCPPPPRQWRQ